MIKKLISGLLVGAMLMFNVPIGYAQEGGGASPRWKAPVQTASDLEPLTSDGSVRIALDTHIVYVFNAATSAWQPVSGAPLDTITGMGTAKDIAVFSGAHVVYGTTAFQYQNDLTGSAGMENIMLVQGAVDQSGTAGYRGLYINVTENTVGSGAYNTPMEIDRNGQVEFAIADIAPGVSALFGPSVFAMRTLGETGFPPARLFALIAPPTMSETTLYYLPDDYPAVNGYVLSCSTTGIMSWQPSSSTAPGLDTQVLFNDGGVTAGASALLWDKNTTTLTTNNIVPQYNTTFSLGSDALRWAVGYITSSLNLGVSGDEVTLRYDTTGHQLQIDKKLRLDGDLDMNGHKIVLTATPGADFDVTNKLYVDNYVAGLSWQAAVKNFFNPTGGLPVGPTLGDRYISSASANGWLINDIYEWNGATWTHTVTTAGFAAFVNATSEAYVFNSSAWVVFASLFSHNALGGLQGGTTAEYYHFTNAEHTSLKDWLVKMVLNSSTGSLEPVTTGGPDLGTSSKYFGQLYVNWINMPDTAGAVGGIVTMGGATFLHNYPGGRCVFLGKNTGNLSSSGTDNVGFGGGAMVSLTSGNFNAGFGVNALAALTSGDNNIGFGANSLQSCTIGSNNEAVGFQALDNLINGVNNVAIGSGAGATIIAGSSDVLIGTGSDVLASGITGSGAIGFNAKVGLNNAIVIGAPTGNVDTVNVGIAVSSPADFKLEVGGSCGPDIDATYDLGSPSLRWGTLYATGFNTAGNIATGIGDKLLVYSNAGVLAGTTDMQYDPTANQVVALSFTDTSFGASFNKSTMAVTRNFNPGGVASGIEQGLNVSVAIPGVNAQNLPSLILYGTDIIAEDDGTGTIGVVQGLRAQGSNIGGTASQVIGIDGVASNMNNAVHVVGLRGLASSQNNIVTGTAVTDVTGIGAQTSLGTFNTGNLAVTNMYGMTIDAIATGGAAGGVSLTNYYGLRVNNLAYGGGGTAPVTTNQYGVYIEQPTQGVGTNYPLWINGGTSMIRGDVQMNKGASSSPNLQMFNGAGRYGQMFYSSSDVLSFTSDVASGLGSYAEMDLGYAAGGNEATLTVGPAFWAAGAKTIIQTTSLTPGTAYGDFIMRGNYNNVYSQNIGIMTRAASSGNGGNIYLTAANATGASNNGGSITLKAGSYTGLGSQGRINMQANNDSTHYLYVGLNGTSPMIGTLGTSDLELSPDTHIVNIDGAVLPTINAAYDLGSDTMRWNGLYLAGTSLHLGVSGNELAVTYDGTEADMSQPTHMHLGSRWGDDVNYFKVETHDLGGTIGVVPFLQPYSASPDYGNIGGFMDNFIVWKNTSNPSIILGGDDGMGGINVATLGFDPASRSLSFFGQASTNFVGGAAMLSAWNSGLSEQLVLNGSPLIGSTNIGGGSRIKFTVRKQAGLFGTDMDGAYLDDILVDANNVTAYTAVVLSTTEAGGVTLERVRFDKDAAQFRQTIRPQVASTYDLGTPALHWRNVYTDTITAPTTQLGQLKVQPATNTNDSTYSAELVSNGNFADGTDWVIGGGSNWTIPGGAGAQHAAGAAGTLSQSVAGIGMNKWYRTSFDITTTVPGTLTANVGGLTSLVFGDAVGTRTGNVLMLGPSILSTALIFSASSSWVGTINNVSVEELTASVPEVLLNDFTAHTSTEIRANTYGKNNLLVGLLAGQGISTGNNDVALGTGAMENGITIATSVAVGVGALTSATSGQDDVAIGNGALALTYATDNSIGIGTRALQHAWGGSNIGIGTETGMAITSGGTNTIVGDQSALGLTIGSNNVILGGAAGGSLVSGSNNILIGLGADVPTNSTSNYLCIANKIYGDLSGNGELTVSAGLKVTRAYYSTKKTDTVVVGAVTADLATGNVHYVQLVNGVNTLTLNNPGDGGRYILVMKQPAAGGAGTVTWPITVKWSGGVAPTLTATNGKVDLISLIYDGTNNCYYAMPAYNF